GRQVQLPAQTAGQCELTAQLPLILAKGEHFRLTPRARDDRDISSHFRGGIEQESGKVICKAGLWTCRSRIQRSGSGAEGEPAPWPEGLCLHEIVAQAAHLAAPFQAVVAVNLGPRVGNADVGLAAVPGQGG